MFADVSGFTKLSEALATKGARHPATSIWRHVCSAAMMAAQVRWVPRSSVSTSTAIWSVSSRHARSLLYCLTAVCAHHVTLCARDRSSRAAVATSSNSQARSFSVLVHPRLTLPALSGDAMLCIWPPVGDEEKKGQASLVEKVHRAAQVGLRGV